MAYSYKMIQIPQSIEVKGKDANQAAATYVESTVNQMASQGWEFYRIDLINVLEQPGCLGWLIGNRANYVTYSVITFRKSA